MAAIKRPYIGGFNTMQNTITWYGRPIKTMRHNGHAIQYCQWDTGARLYAVNGRAFNQLNNAQFSYFLSIVLNNLEA
jgi:hypothetical protein